MIPWISLESIVIPPFLSLTLLIWIFVVVRLTEGSPILFKMLFFLSILYLLKNEWDIPYMSVKPFDLWCSLTEVSLLIFSLDNLSKDGGEYGSHPSVLFS